jgi:hypothetical protein
MLPLNRVYTPQELRAASRLTPTDRPSSLGVHRTAAPPDGRGRRGNLVAALLRRVGRSAVRRSAPSAI